MQFASAGSLQRSFASLRMTKLEQFKMVTKLAQLMMTRLEQEVSVESLTAPFVLSRKRLIPQHLHARDPDHARP